MDKKPKGFPAAFRSLAISISLALFASFFILFLSDKAMALFNYPVEPPIKISHPANYSKIIKNIEFTYHLKTNSQGIRYRELPFDKKSPGDYRFAVVGDSFTEGLGVEMEQTFESLLENRLSTTDREIAFINCGLTGASPADYARLLYNVGFKYKPDRVVVMVYANDIGDTTILSENDIETGEGWLIPRKNDPGRKGFKRVAHWTLPRIYTQINILIDYFAQRPRNLVKAAIKQARRIGVSKERIEEWEQSLPQPLVQAANRKEFSPDHLTRELFNPRFWKESLDIEGEKAELKWKTMSGILSKVVAWCNERRIPVSIVYAPSPLQYDPDFQLQIERYGGAVKKEWLTQDTENEKRLRQFANDGKLHFLSLTPYFRVSHKKMSGGCHYRMDGHWTAMGNKLVASLMLKWILDNNMIPGAKFALNPKYDFIFDEATQDLLFPADDVMDKPTEVNIPMVRQKVKL